MASAVVKRLPKPDLTYPYRKSLYKDIYLSLGVGTAAAVAGYFFWYIPKWRAIEAYEKNYDPFAEMERQRQLGLFSSVPPDYIIEERKQKALAKAAKKKQQKK